MPPGLAIAVPPPSSYTVTLGWDLPPDANVMGFQINVACGNQWDLFGQVWSLDAPPNIILQTNVPRSESVALTLPLMVGQVQVPHDLQTAYPYSWQSNNVYTFFIQGIGCDGQLSNPSFINPRSQFATLTCSDTSATIEGSFDLVNWFDVTNMNGATTVTVPCSPKEFFRTVSTNSNAARPILKPQ